jgi:UDP-glucuronate decarboxylase
MNSPDEVTGPINIGNPHEISVRELAERVIAATRSRSRVIFAPLPQDDPVQRCPDISMARRVLGWQPEVDLDQGLSRTIDYFRGLIRTDEPEV